MPDNYRTAALISIVIILTVLGYEAWQRDDTTELLLVAVAGVMVWVRG